MVPATRAASSSSFFEDGSSTAWFFQPKGQQIDIGMSSPFGRAGQCDQGAAVADPAGQIVAAAVPEQPGIAATPAARVIGQDDHIKATQVGAGESCCANGRYRVTNLPFEDIAQRTGRIAVGRFWSQASAIRGG